jgi:hypothetical protein
MRYICLIFISICSFCFAKNKDALLLLHFDLNKTIIAKDTVEKKSAEDIFNILLSRGYKDIWNDEIKEPLTFSKYMEKYILPGEKGDKKLKQQRVDFEANFLKYLNKSNHPNFEKMKLMYNKLLEKNKLANEGVFSSFHKLIDYLNLNQINYKIIFRTFGSDTEEIVKELNQRYPDINIMKKARFIKGKLVFSDNYVIENLLDQYNYIKNANGWVPLQDDWHYWMEHSLNQEYGKVFPIDLEDENCISIFFDDNVVEKKSISNIVSPFDVNTGKPIIVFDLVKKKHVFKVDPIDAILNDNYYIDLINQSLEN